MVPSDNKIMSLVLFKQLDHLLKLFELSRQDLDDNPDIALDIVLITETLVSINRRIAERAMEAEPEELTTSFTSTGRTMTLINGGKDG